MTNQNLKVAMKVMSPTAWILRIWTLSQIGSKKNDKLGIAYKKQGIHVTPTQLGQQITKLQRLGTTTHTVEPTTRVM